MPGTATTIGPFVGGLNTRSDPTAVADSELVRCENFELDLDGSLVSRPPFVDKGVSFPLAATGNVQILGYFYAAGSVPYLLASDGLSSTYYYSGSSWVLVTATIAATAMVQFNGQAWLLAPVGSANPGGYWTPGGGFVAQPNLPKGTVIVSQKSRLWVAAGRDATTNGTRLYFSNVLGSTTFWPTTPEFLDIGAGDGQNIVQVVVYYNNLLIFRTNSVYTYQYSADPASGVVSLIIPGIGLTDKDAIVEHESYIYFMFEDRAYEFYNNRATQINIKAPFEAVSRSGLYAPYSVSVFGNRVIFSYFDTMFVFSLNTRTWTTWVSSAYGAIGKITAVDQLGEVGSAVAHSSKAVGPSTSQFNYATNPKGIQGGAAVASVNDSTLNVTELYAAGGTGNHPPGRPDLNSGVVAYIKPGATTPYVVSAYNVDGLTASSLSRRLGAWLYMSRAGFEVRVGIVGPFVPVPQGWTWVASTVSESGYNAGGFYVKTINNSNALPNDIAIIVGITVLEGGVTPQSSDMFYGGMPTDSSYTYAWTGAVNASSSYRVTRRKTKTLFISEAPTSDKEVMTCTILTKNYNYEASSIYKRLFWWGVDSAFRGRVTGIVTPIVYSYAIMWSKLLSTTWGAVRNFTWSQPLSGTLNVETDRDTGGSGAQRKFVKFKAPIRFRQVNFKVIFETDGSTDTAPVRLFSLMTYVSAKERVSKTVT